MEIKDDKVISGPGLKAPILDCSVGEFLLPKMKSQPKDNIIQVDSETGTSQTTLELLQLSLGVAEGLLKIGLQEGDVVAFVSKDRSELFAAALGVILAGGVAAPIYPEMTIEEMKHTFEVIQPKYAFSEKEAVENVEEVLSLLGLDAQIILFEDNETPNLTMRKLLIEVDVETYKPRPTSSPSTQLSLIVMTSGATKSPKAVGLTHQNIIFLLSTLKANDKPMPCLQWAPFWWITGTRMFLVSLATGMTRIFIRNLTDENVLKAIDTFKPIWSAIPPTPITSLMNHPHFKDYDVSSIKLIVTGGSAVSEHLIDRLKKDWSNDITVQILYGSTESFGIVTEAVSNVHSVGKPGPGVHIKIVDMATKKSLGPNQNGEVCIKSRGLMKRYVGDPNATKEATDSDGWFHTGDIGYYDDNENLCIVDRIEDVIKFGKWEISPTELENLIETLPGVEDVGVIGVPSENGWRLPMASVVKRKGSNVSEEEVISIVKENVPDWKHLRGGVKFVDSIPRTPTGKIIRPKLKELAGLCTACSATCKPIRLMDLSEL